jgi:tetratricopeptide (TPR) repeat protein
MPISLAPPSLKREVLLDAVDRYLAGDIPETEDTALWRASVAVYLGRVDDGRAALRDARPSTFGDILAAELDLAEGKYEEARARLSRLSRLDPSLAARAAIDFARVAQQEGKWEEVGRYADEAIRLARIADDRAWEGMGYRLRAIGRSAAQGADEVAEIDFRRSVDLLRETEDLRFRAFAELSLARRLVVIDDAPGACTLLDSAESTFLRLGLELDAQTAQNARAWAELVAGRYEDALRRSLAALEVDRAQGCARGETWALRASAVASVFAGRFDDAVRLADAALSLARVAGSVPDLLEAHLLACRARARTGDVDAIDALDALLPAIDALNQAPLSATARVVKADALLGLDHPRAFVARDEAEPGRALRGPWLQAEFRHLDDRWSTQVIRREGSRLVVDFAAGTPCLSTAHLLVDYASLDSVSKTATRKTDAARLLCLTRRNYYKVKAGVEARLQPNPVKTRPRRVRRSN